MTPIPKSFQAIYQSFPIEPLPAQFFWTECSQSLDCDLPQELFNQFSGRKWTAIKIHDWASTGADPWVVRTYFDPPTFAYYLPSLLVDTLVCGDRFEFAMEAIIPSGRSRKPKGRWWDGFANCITSAQRSAIQKYLLDVKCLYGDLIGPANQSLLGEAEAFWS